MVGRRRITGSESCSGGWDLNGSIVEDHITSISRDKYWSTGGQYLLHSNENTACLMRSKKPAVLDLLVAVSNRSTSHG